MTIDWQNVTKKYLLVGGFCVLLLTVVLTILHLRDDGAASVPDKASVDEIQLVLNEIAAQDNVIAVLNQLGPFPEIQTPTGAQVTSFDSIIEPRESAFWAQTKVDFEVVSSIEEIFSFYTTFAQQNNWNVASQNQPQLGSLATAHLTLEPTGGYPTGSSLDIQVTQYTPSPTVRLSISFQQPFESSQELGLGKWTNWHSGKVPIPTGGQQVGGGAGRFGRNTISAIHTYENTDAEQVKSAVLSASENLAFTLDPSTDEATTFTLTNTSGIEVRYVIEMRQNISFLWTTAEYIS